MHACTHCLKRVLQFFCMFISLFPTHPHTSQSTKSEYWGCGKVHFLFLFSLSSTDEKSGYSNFGCLSTIITINNLGVLIPSNVSIQSSILLAQILVWQNNLNLINSTGSDLKVYVKWIFSQYLINDRLMEPRSPTALLHSPKTNLNITKTTKTRKLLHIVHVD